MQKKRTLVLDTILLENEYDSAPPLNVSALYFITASIYIDTPLLI